MAGHRDGNGRVRSRVPLIPYQLLRLLSSHSGGAGMLALGVLAGGLNSSLQAWCVRNKEFKHTSFSQLTRGFSSSSLQLCFGIAGTGAPGLVVSSVLAELLAGLNLAVASRRDVRGFLTKVRWKRLKRLAADYRDFPCTRLRRIC